MLIRIQNPAKNWVQIFTLEKRAADPPQIRIQQGNPNSDIVYGPQIRKFFLQDIKNCILSLKE
jgi:hypothetical protein